MKQTDTSRSRETELKENRVYEFSTKEFEKGMKKAIGYNAIGYIEGIAKGRRLQKIEDERELRLKMCERCMFNKQVNATEIYAKALADVEKIIPEWFIGQQVSHKCDAEKPEMAIEIISKKVDKQGICMYKCSYVNKEYMRTLGWKKKYFWNSGNQFRELKSSLQELGK